MKYSGADWLQRQGVILSPFGEKVANILGQVYQGIYHMSNTALFHKRTNWSDERCIQIAVYGELSTWDYNRLMYLVLLAHDECVRISISGASYRYLKLSFSPRQRTGGTMERHPTIEDHIKMLREDLNTQTAPVRPPTKTEDKPVPKEKED